MTVVIQFDYTVKYNSHLLILTAIVVWKIEIEKNLDENRLWNETGRSAIQMDQPWL